MGGLGQTGGNRTFEVGKQPSLMSSSDEEQSTGPILPALFRC
jgi:hypothetical protein